MASGLSFSSLFCLPCSSSWESASLSRGAPLAGCACAFAAGNLSERAVSPVGTGFSWLKALCARARPAATIATAKSELRRYGEVFFMFRPRVDDYESSAAHASGRGTGDQTNSAVLSDEEFRDAILRQRQIHHSKWRQPITMFD